MQFREAIEWCDVWISGADKNDLSRILLVGDSITRAYFPHVETLLEGRYNCARVTSSRSVCDATFIKELRLVLDEYSFAAIHFNNGLHGWDYNDSTYAASLKNCITFVQQQTPHLIWAQTTPVRSVDDIQELAALNERVIERNRLAQEIAAAHSVPVNDLYTLVETQSKYYIPDGVHFNEEGSAALARQVASSILAHTTSA